MKIIKSVECAICGALHNLDGVNFLYFTGSVYQGYAGSPSKGRKILIDVDQDIDGSFLVCAPEENPDCIQKIFGLGKFKRDA